MSLDSKYRPARPSPLLHFVTPPRTPENQKYPETFPYPRLSSQRRLFPRRTVLPSLIVPDTDTNPSFSPSKVHSAPGRCFADYDDRSVDNGSSCSSGSTKILRLSSLDLLSDDPIFESDISPCGAALLSRPGNVEAAALREETLPVKPTASRGSVLEEHLNQHNRGGLVYPHISELDAVTLTKEIPLREPQQSGSSALAHSPNELDDDGEIAPEFSNVGPVNLMEETSLRETPEYDGSVLDGYLCELNNDSMSPPRIDGHVDSVQPADSMRCDSQASILTARWAPHTEVSPTIGPVPFTESSVMRCGTPLENSCHEVETWDSAVTVCTTASIFKDRKVIVHYHVDMTVVVPKIHMSTDRVRLTIMVSNGLRRSCIKEMMPGLSSLCFEEDGLAQSSPYEDHELVVFRNACDLRLPLKLYLSFTYPSQSHHAFITTVPTFRPKQGTTLSEKIFINKPSTPLIIKPLARNHLSCWKSRFNSTTQVTRFERARMPRLYPEDLRDDIHLRITDPRPVFFESLHDLDPSDVVWNLNIVVEEAIGGKVECDLSFNVEVGVGNPVVVLNARGWRPKFFAIDGRLVTEQSGAWGTNEDGYVALYKEGSMTHGPIRIETHWEEPKDRVSVDGDNPADITLPILMDLRVVGGKLACRLSEMRLAVGYSQLNGKGPLDFDRSGKTSNLYALGDAPYVRLPDMYPGHKLWLTPDLDGLHLPLPALLEEIEPFDYPSKKARIVSDVGHGEHCEVPPTKHDGQVPLYKRSSINISLLHVLLFLLPLCLTLGLLCLILVQNNYIEPFWRDGSKTNCKIEGDCGLQNVTEVLHWQGSTHSGETAVPMEVDKAVVAYNRNEAMGVQNKDEAKSGGLGSVRDWIDHALGWEEWHGYA
ncbi:hypothetical protein N7G274_006351 [Stereocaulon virgatum]|uniref:Uncharacterized protein n=1 Tax=Stereocaulon virgatum TaxID=373712 RepID=A0ABR4A754_9LECA